MNILLLSYQISPTRGSEYGVGWNFAINLSRHHSVFVLCGASGDHMGDTDEIRDYAENNTNSNLHIIPVRPSRLTELINWPNRTGIFSWIFYLAIQLWNRTALIRAREIINEYEIDIVHHLTPIGFREPGYLWKLNKPFVWGPIGGAHFVHTALLKPFPVSFKLSYLLKNTATFLQLHFQRRSEKAAKKASALIFAYSDAANKFLKYYKKSGTVISEVGTSYFTTDVTKKGIEKQYFKFVWSGRICVGKSLYFLFDALFRIKDDPSWRLDIIGDGSLKKKMIKLSVKRGLSDRITWHGKKSRDEAIEIMNGSDLHLFTSISEATATVVMEAISLGIPTISLDHCGMHDVLGNGNGILVPITTYKDSVVHYAGSLRILLHDRKKLESLRNRTLKIREDYLWGKKIEQVIAIYRNVLEQKL